MLKAAVHHLPHMVDLTVHAVVVSESVSTGVIDKLSKSVIACFHAALSHRSTNVREIYPGQKSITIDPAGILIHILITIMKPFFRMLPYYLTHIKCFVISAKRIEQIKVKGLHVQEQHLWVCERAQLRSRVLKDKV